MQNSNHRRGLTGDREPWTSSKPRRDDGTLDSGQALNGEGNFGSNRNHENRRNEGRDAGDEGSQQYKPTRGAQNSSWHRNEDQQGSKPSKRENAGNRDWGDKEKNGARQQRRGWEGHQEQDPEWMNDPEVDSKKQQIHTQEDFQRWKEKMKAGNKTEPERTTSPSQRPDHERTFSGISNTIAKTKVETPLVLSNGLDDGFFSVLTSNQNEMKAERIHDTTNGQTIRAGKSKFTNFFAPKPEPQAQKDSLPQAPASVPATTTTGKPVSDEDKEGFERILGLLGQSQRATTQQESPRDSNAHNASGPPPSRQEQSLEREGKEGPFGIGDGAPSQDRNSEFLLHLMQQPGQSRPQSNSKSSSQFSSFFPQSQPTPPSSQTPSAPPGFTVPTSRPSASEMDRRIREARQQAAGNSFFDTLSRPSLPDNAQPNNASTVGMQRPPPGLDQHFPSNFLPYTQQQQSQQQNMPSGPPQQQHNLVSPPPGFPPTNQLFMSHPTRPPPHLQQNAPPQQPQPQQQQQYSMFPPGLIPNALGPQQQQQHQAQQNRPPPPHGNFMNAPPPGFGGTVGGMVNGRGGSPPRGFYGDFSYRG